MRCPFAPAREEHGDAARLARGSIPTLRSWSGAASTAGLEPSRPRLGDSRPIPRFVRIPGADQPRRPRRGRHPPPPGGGEGVRSGQHQHHGKQSEAPTTARPSWLKMVISPVHPGLRAGAGERPGGPRVSWGPCCRPICGQWGFGTTACSETRPRGPRMGCRSWRPAGSGPSVMAPYREAAFRSCAHGRAPGQALRCLADRGRRNPARLTVDRGCREPSGPAGGSASRPT